MIAMCAVEYCGRVEVLRRGWCELHYVRWKRTGNPLNVRKPGSPGLPGSRHPQWKDDGDITYEAAHIRLRAARGPASEHMCTDCGASADQWSYTHDCPDERFDEHRGCAYSTDPHRYVPRCFSCHTKFDHGKAAMA